MQSTIAVSLMPPSAASRICAPRFSLRVACTPPLSRTVSPSRSASLNSTRYRMFMLSPDDRGPEMNPAASEVRPHYTAEQGQYLAFIHAYRRLHGRAPAEADIQRFFRVSPPSVHQMILTLERAGLISRRPGVARSVGLTIDPRRLPELHSGHDQPVKTTVQRH